MKKISKIILPVLLLLLTVLTVAAPRIVNAVTDSRLLAEKTEWDFSRNDSPEISGAQAAELYRTGQLDLYSSPDNEVIMNDSALPDTPPQSVYSMLARVFGRESDIYAYFEKNISEEICFVSQKKSIALVGERPVAFNTVWISINMRDGSVINLSYEERTLVPLRLFIKYSYSLGYGFSPPETNQLENVLRDYSYTVFSLEPGEYMLYSESYDYEEIKSGNFLYSIAASQPESDYNFK